MSGNSGPGYRQHPEHHVDLAREPQRVQVVFNGEKIADSSNVITVKETGHDPVYYFPRQDVQMQRLVRSDHHTHCPFKGEASYYSLSNDRPAKNAVWSYERPYDEVLEIKGRLAFYPENVHFITGT
jgi:uncharacterized protein (DUF427 family)